MHTKFVLASAVTVLLVIVVACSGDGRGQDAPGRSTTTFGTPGQDVQQPAASVFVSRDDWVTWHGDYYDIQFPEEWEFSGREDDFTITNGGPTAQFQLETHDMPRIASTLEDYIDHYTNVYVIGESSGQVKKEEGISQSEGPTINGGRSIELRYTEHRDYGDYVYIDRTFLVGRKALTFSLVGTPDVVDNYQDIFDGISDSFVLKNPLPDDF